AEDGGHGGWAVLYGSSPFGTSLDLAIDEETVAGDTTRKHTKEQVAYWVMLHEPIDSAEMKFNEVLYQETTLGTANDEFIEFYVTQSGNLKNYLFTDQDGASHHYRFPSHMVSKGDYVVLHIGSGTNSVVGNVHHFYKGSSQYLNNTGDELLLLKPSNTDSTTVDGEEINGVPFDYVAYDVAGDAIPTSTNGVSLSWNGSEISRLADASDGTSISLTPNAIDGDTSLCWEITAISDVTKKASNCVNYLSTTDTNTNAGMINSMGQSNTQSPDIKLSKSSLTVYDPINLTTNPKAIPGAIVKYSISAINEGLGSTDVNSIAIVDKVPDNMRLCVITLNRCNETVFVDGTVSSTLSLGSLEYSNNNGVDFNYTPTADVEGFDGDVTHIRMKLDGSFAASDGINHPSFTLDLTMGID
ncbi:MAG TPA: lamin tail domain-containing protein, partial [Campylobacterales bacterium]|nr:lamin tail domain-containing protein [Campylobacterales bacterium]